jgi:hypothetical protein
MTSGAAYSPVTEDEHFIVGDRRILKFPVYTDITLSERVDILTGFTFVWYLRRDEAEEPALLEKTAQIEDDLQGGLAVVTIEAADTTVEMAGLLTHALKRTDTSAEITVAYGPFELLLTASRDE